MPIPTEPIGSIPRPAELQAAMAARAAGEIDAAALAAAGAAAVADTIRRFEATGSPVITDGEQTKSSFATYPVEGVPNVEPGGVTITFADGHTRRLPRLTAGPFAYGVHAASYLEQARAHARVPVKQAVISASALSLLYPPEGVDGYPVEAFLGDLVGEAEADIRGALDGGAHHVRIDFTEGRLALKMDPSGGLLRRFVDLNNRVLDRFSEAERSRIGIHTCPGGDHDSTHSADVDYAGLLPTLFDHHAGSFYVQLASEPDRPCVLAAIAGSLRPGQRVFVGVIDPIDPEVETPEEVRDRVLEAAAHLPAGRFGTCDDCGFSPFADDTSTARETAFDKIRSRVLGTELAAKELGL